MTATVTPGGGCRPQEVVERRTRASGSRPGSCLWRRQADKGALRITYQGKIAVLFASKHVMSGVAMFPSALM